MNPRARGLLHTVRTLARNDLRLVLRDKMLVLLLSMVVLMGIAAREVLPALDASLRASGVLPSAAAPFAFAATFPMWVTFIGLWQAALMPGTVFAFLPIDEKEDGSLTAMRVTPVPFERYVGYRVALPGLLAFGFALLLPPLIGHAPVAWWQLPLFAAAAALTAPIATALLSMYAKDKVQGLAFTKFGGVAGLVILVGWFVPEPWQWGLGIFPPFLVCKGYWMAAAGRAGWWLPLLVGAGVQAAMIAPLLRRFRRVVS